MKRLCSAVCTLILALTASVALVVCCTACSSSPPKQTVSGTWELQAIDSENPPDTHSSDQIAQLRASGFPMNLVLSDDGSATFNLFGDSLTGSWTEKGDSKVELTLDGMPIEASLQNGKLSFTTYGDTFTFAKQGA